jgi:hypothetical protein
MNAADADDNAGETFLLRLRAVRDSRPAAIRLRLLLKDLLRGYGFRCEKVEDVTPPAAEKEKGD